MAVGTVGRGPRGPRALPHRAATRSRGVGGTQNVPFAAGGLSCFQQPALARERSGPRVGEGPVLREGGQEQCRGRNVLVPDVWGPVSICLSVRRRGGGLPHPPPRPGLHSPPETLPWVLCPDPAFGLLRADCPFPSPPHAASSRKPSLTAPSPPGTAMGCCFSRVRFPPGVSLSPPSDRVSLCPLNPAPADRTAWGGLGGVDRSLRCPCQWLLAWPPSIRPSRRARLPRRSGC